MNIKSKKFSPEVKLEQLNQSYSSTPLSMIFTLVNACLLYYLLNPVTPHYHAVIWLAVITVITTARFLLYFSFRLNKPSAVQTKKWSHFFTLGSLAAGTAWGAASIFLFPDDSIPHQVFIAFIIAGMTAGAVTTLSCNWRDAFLFIMPALLLLIYRYLLIDSPISDAMSIMVSLYLVILLSSSMRFYKNNIQNIVLRHESKQREHHLQQFKTTLDQTLDCVFMFDSQQLNFFYFNQGALDQVGYSKNELLTMHPFDIKPDFDEAAFRAIIQLLLDGDFPSITFETIHQNKNGSTIPVEIFLQYIEPPEEQPLFVAIVRDITERKRLDRSKDEFVSTVSHELRTPLTSLRGSLGLILGGAVGNFDEKQMQLLNIAQQNTERLLLLINDILDIQKIETGNLDFHFINTDLVKLVKTSIEQNKAYADNYDVTFIFQQPETVCQIHADPDRILQVLGNLLSNAAKFSPRGADIDIQIETNDKNIRLNVIDHGPGISSDYTEHIFDKFTQSDATDQRQHGGTGLGLAIAKSIIEKHNGTIGFDSREGQGTKFYFEVPSST